MEKRLLFITVLAFAAFFYFDEFFFQNIRRGLDQLIDQRGLSHMITYIIVGIPLFLGILMCHKRKDFWRSLGLNRSLSKAFIFAVVCVLPMIAAYVYFFDFNVNLTLNLILINAVAAGFFEELYFRGFLFGQFYRYTRLGFFSSVLLAALLPATAHLFLGSDLVEIIIVFLIAFISGIIFSWLYAEWNYNLWVSVFLHMFINLSWEMFVISENPQGDQYAILVRIFTVILVTLLTVIYKKRKRINFEVSPRKLFMKNRRIDPAL